MDSKRKSRTTYGVYNLIEWGALLRMGKATVKVHFTGGSITTQGVTPATYTTEDPVIQFAIERSPEFKNGRIKIVRSVELAGKVEIEMNPAALTEEKKSSDDSELPDNSDNPIAEGTEGTEDSGDNAEAGKVIEMEFSCNDDAKDYLEETYGFVRSKLRNREDIVAAGKSKGVEIIFE